MWTPRKLDHADKIRNPPPKPVRRWEYVRNGKRKLVPLTAERSKVWEMTPEQATWKRISDNLDAYNRRVGRI